MKVLHILRTEPDDTVKKIVAAATNGDQAKTVQLHEGDIDWPHLVDDIFSHDKVVCWW